MGGNNNNGHCIPSAELRLKQARLDLATDRIIADPTNEEASKARDLKDAAVGDWIRYSSEGSQTERLKGYGLTFLRD